MQALEQWSSSGSPTRVVDDEFARVLRAAHDGDVVLQQQVRRHQQFLQRAPERMITSQSLCMPPRC